MLEKPTHPMATTLTNELHDASQRIGRHSCGSAVALRYEPGATLVWCHKCGQYVDALPDWQPDAMVERFNTANRTRNGSL